MHKPENDPIMDEVYANRREISLHFGNDPKRYTLPSDSGSCQFRESDSP